MKPAPKRRGRRPAAEGSAREAILKAARQLFLSDGYDASSLRAIAARAQVDPALIHHYFDDKADLFAEAIKVPFRPDRIVKLAVQGPRDKVGVNAVTLALTALEQEKVRGAVVGLIRTAMGHDFAAGLLRQFLMREVFSRIAAELTAEHEMQDAELRATLAASQMVGLFMVRYGLKIDPLTTASIDEVAARVGPVIQWHLLGYPGSMEPADSTA